MRNLTIIRRKSFVGCAMKDQVYIRDEQAAETTIEGVPCRKLGDLKNGEQKTFQIGEGQQQIFLIVDKLSKEYCNASVVIPEGQEDVCLSGKHYFALGSNPFQFDGVQLSAEQIAKRKKNNRKGTAIFAGAVIVGAVIGLFLPGSFFGPDTTTSKTFVKEDFRITLNDNFKETQEDGFFAFYESKAVIVFALREDAELFEDITLEEYGKLVLEANNRTGAAMNKADDFIWFSYTDAPEDQEIYYMAGCYQSEEAFWIVNFATPVSNREKYEIIFMQWAESVEVGNAQ